MPQHHRPDPDPTPPRQQGDVDELKDAGCPGGDQGADGLTVAQNELLAGIGKLRRTRSPGGGGLEREQRLVYAGQRLLTAGGGDRVK